MKLAVSQCSLCCLGVLTVVLPSALTLSLWRTLLPLSSAWRQSVTKVCVCVLMEGKSVFVSTSEDRFIGVHSLLVLLLFLSNGLFPLPLSL